MEQEKTMSIRKQMFYLKICGGIAWIIGGVFYPIENAICSAICAAAFVVAMIIFARVAYANKEATDEMAESHLAVAKAKALDIMEIIVCVVAMTCIIFFKSMDAGDVNVIKILIAFFFVILGIEHFMVGVFFKKLEEE